MDIRDLYQELIIDHGTNPRNCCAMPTANGTAEGFNPLCGDKIQVFLNIEDETIKKATFTGKGCAISTASASLMTEALHGKTIKEALSLSLSFKTLLTKDKDNTLTITPLGKLEALLGVREFPARVKCATLAWHTLQAAIKQESTTLVTTELI